MKRRTHTDDLWNFLLFVYANPGSSERQFRTSAHGSAQYAHQLLGELVDMGYLAMSKPQGYRQYTTTPAGADLLNSCQTITTSDQQLTTDPEAAPCP